MGHQFLGISIKFEKEDEVTVVSTGVKGIVKDIMVDTSKDCAFYGVKVPDETSEPGKKWFEANQLRKAEPNQP